MRHSSIVRILACIAGILVLSAAAFSQQDTPSKKNARPAGSASTGNASGPAVPIPDFEPVYTYEFNNPKFNITRVLIEHDEEGRGRIVFRQKDFEEDIEEGLALSEASVTKIRELWEKSGFAEAEAGFQSPERDYAHLGTMRLTLDKDGREKTDEFNWTEVAEAKELTDEYKRVGNQAIWRFEIEVARRNQPLETPRLMNKLATYLRLNSISDPPALIPFLTELGDDERLPLIARNHAKRMIKDLEKGKK